MFGFFFVKGFSSTDPCFIYENKLDILVIL